MAGGIRRAVVALGAVIAMLALPGSAAACSCAPMTAEGVRKADAAAVVKLESFEPLSDFKADYTYSVRDVVAGGGLREGRTVTIRGSRGGAACGLSEKVGEKSGLVMQRRKDRWLASSCSSTSPKRLRRLAAKGKGQRAPSARTCPK